MPDDQSPIRTLRRSAGLTQGQLGEYAGVTRQTIAAIEKGDYAPSVYLALRIARRLDSTVEHLFPLDKEPS
jgi:putative transcriptional regulator